MTPDPIAEEHREMMNKLCALLDVFFNPEEGPKKVGFFLAVFNFNEQGRFNYISNADKIDVKTMLQDIVKRIEAREAAEKGTKNG